MPQEHGHSASTSGRPMSQEHGHSASTSRQPARKNDESFAGPGGILAYSETAAGYCTEQERFTSYKALPEVRERTGDCSCRPSNSFLVKRSHSARTRHGVRTGPDLSCGLRSPAKGALLSSQGSIPRRWDSRDFQQGKFAAKERGREMLDRIVKSNEIHAEAMAANRLKGAPSSPEGGAAVLSAVSVCRWTGR